MKSFLIVGPFRYHQVVGTAKSPSLNPSLVDTGQVVTDKKKSEGGSVSRRCDGIKMQGPREQVLKIRARHRQGFVTLTLPPLYFRFFVVENKVGRCRRTYGKRNPILERSMCMNCQFFSKTEGSPRSIERDGESQKEISRDLDDSVDKVVEETLR